MDPHYRPAFRLTTVLVLLLGAVLAAVGAWWGTQHARPASAQDAVTAVDPELMRRFELARADARAEGITLTITSGWRSAAEQQDLVDDAVDRYGDDAEAHRWVLPPETSAHVQGTAIDVGDTAGALWLGDRQERYGLCRT